MSAPRAKVLIMAGGTGGHIFPGLAVADRLRASGTEVDWLGTPYGLENRLVPACGYRLHHIDIKGLRGKGWLGWLAAPWRILRAGWQANKLLKAARPCAVLSMGGYVAGPGGLAARWRGIPLLIHEQNRIPGLTNRLLARWAKRIYQGFPDSFPASREACTAGNPVRAEIIASEEPQTRLGGRKGPLRLLVVGGSQGALALNRLLPRALAGLDMPLRVRHQAGRGHQADTEESYRRFGVGAEVTEFIEDMAAAYGWADLVVCRAGALTVAEVAAVGVAALFIPFPAAVDDHQTHNAGYLAEAGAAEIVDQRGLDAESLRERLRPLLGDRQKLLGMALAARGKALPAAAETVAAGCRELCR